MSIVEYTLLFTIISRFISHARYRRLGTQSNIQISGGEISKFILTFFFLYCWNAVWFTIIRMLN